MTSTKLSPIKINLYAVYISGKIILPQWNTYIWAPADQMLLLTCIASNYGPGVYFFPAGEGEKEKA